MAWTISFDNGSEKDLRKLDKSIQKKIMGYLKERVTDNGDPRSIGKPLRGKLSGIWRYRLGSYRILCQLLDDEKVVLIIGIAHRKHAYQKQ